jgi:hypothetical protein
MTHIERYQNAEAFNVQTHIIKLREEIGTLDDLRSPTRSEVEEKVEEIFPNLLTHEKTKLVEAFMHSEEQASRDADQHAA